MAIPGNAIELAQLVERSELIEKHRLAPYMQFLLQPGCPIQTPKDCALAMIREGLITLFQAKLLLQGKWRNFYIGTKYKVLEHLGSGGMGTVYLCEHKHMRRRVAVKLLSTDKNQATGVQRFVREAQAVAMLNHPNIVQAHDIDQDGPLHFLVMEFIDGVALQRLIEITGPLSVARAVNYIAQATHGLQHAWGMRLVHRDIKPNNLLLDRAGVIKILDLGLARFAETGDNLTQMVDSKAILGTADYLAPEQAINPQVDIRADIYGLGCVFYFLLTGSPPFGGGTVAQKLVKHQSIMPDPLHKIRADIPMELSNIVNKMLMKNPDHRFQEPIQVFDALQPWLEDVAPPTAEEMPANRFSQHRDLDTMSKLSTVPGGEASQSQSMRARSGMYTRPVIAKSALS
jgi:eukaryotic-like serine/threonine-protein kinase